MNCSRSCSLGAQSGPELCKHWQTPTLTNQRQKTAIWLYSNSRSRGERSHQPTSAKLSVRRPMLPGFAVAEHPGAAGRGEEEG